MRLPQRCNDTTDLAEPLPHRMQIPGMAEAYKAGTITYYGAARDDAGAIRLMLCTHTRHDHSGGPKSKGWAWLSRTYKTEAAADRALRSLNC